MIRVLIADDSPTSRRLLREILGSDPAFQVVGEAVDGEEALRLSLSLRPDLVTMDVQMPGLDGFEATRRIMRERPVPIVIVSGTVDPREVQVSLRALQAGALHVLSKPPGPASPDFEEAARRLRRTLSSLARVQVVRRRDPEGPVAEAPPSPTAGRSPEVSPLIVGLAASTGGPGALAALFGGLPAGFPWPILAVQHISLGFVEGLARLLDGESALEVRLAVEGEVPRAGTVLLAPDDRHLVLQAGAVALSQDPPIESFRPSATALFASLARSHGPRAVGLMLTGMGSDGVAGMRELAATGALLIAQDPESCAVNGMPQAAVSAGLIHEILNPAAMVARLCGLAGVAPEGSKP